MVQWEYKMEEVDYAAKDKPQGFFSGETMSMQTALNRLGADGWELVAIWDHRGETPDSLVRTKGNAIFKRPKS